MRKVYYSLMRNPAIALPFVVVCAFAAWVGGESGASLGGRAAGVAQNRVAGIA